MKRWLQWKWFYVNALGLIALALILSVLAWQKVAVPTNIVKVATGWASLVLGYLILMLVRVRNSGGV